ncbi:MAG: leucine--tRNA ligase, partial [Deltaproteobacteria bacterium]|nr:leucine--tRNA ligase [Deltaproteobacteria bacterium]
PFLLGHTESIYGAPWPAFDPAALVEASVTVAVQVNGKLRGTFEVARGADKTTLLAAAHSVENVAKYLEGAEVLKEIVVPDKLVGFVVKGA